MTVTKFGYEMNYTAEVIDLRPYADLAMRRMWRIQFPNKYGASIIGGGPGTWGDGEKTFEVMVLYKGEPCDDTPIANDVLGYQSEDEVHDILKQLENLT